MEFHESLEFGLAQEFPPQFPCLLILLTLLDHFQWQEVHCFIKKSVSCRDSSGSLPSRSLRSVLWGFIELHVYKTTTSLLCPSALWLGHNLWLEHHFFLTILGSSPEKKNVQKEITIENPKGFSGLGILTPWMIKKHEVIHSLSLKIGHSTQPHTLLAFLSLSGFCPHTSFKGNHHRGEVMKNQVLSHLSLFKLTNKVHNP